MLLLFWESGVRFMGLEEILEGINETVEKLNYQDAIKFIEELERLEKER